MDTPTKPRSSQSGWWLAGSLFLVTLAGIVGFGFPGISALSSTLSPAAEPVPARIDGDRAYGYLKSICDLGPRIAGSEANTRQRAMVAAHFAKNGGKVVEQPFTVKHPLTGQDVQMANLVASWFPERTERIVIGAHYDTRPFPDQEKDPAKQKSVFIGANDCASGVALLMEMSNHIADLSTPWGVDFVLFDGEELVYQEVGNYFHGSKEFARRYVEEAKAAPNPIHYRAGVVLDMIGGKDLRIDQEQYSVELAPEIIREIWGVAAKLKEQKTFPIRIGRAVNDDHLALNNAGIPTVDLIDFEYPYWHTARDVPANCTGTSLAKVGRVLTGWLSMPKPVARKKS